MSTQKGQNKIRSKLDNIYKISLSKKDIDGKSWKQISFFEKKVWEN